MPDAPALAQTTGDDAPYVFISYANVDRERVLPVAEALQRAGIPVWLDQQGIAGGENYGTVIADAIKGSVALVLMASAASLSSRNVKQEIALGWRFERPYLPLLLEVVTIPDELAYWLEAAQWVEVLDKPEGEWLPAVLKALMPLGLAPATPPREEIRLAGRERELSSLRRRLEQARAGKGGLVLIGGEAGVGKSALAGALLREAAGHGCTLLEGHCFDLTETPPYGPWVDLFAHLPAAQSLPPPDAFARRGTVGAVASQMALFVAVEDFLSALTRTVPAVLLLDDLHWADPASLDLVHFLVRSLASLPLLVLATYRSDELTRKHPLSSVLPQLVREATVARLDLAPLDEAAIRALVTARYTLAGGDVSRLVAFLQARADGNAFFVGELLRALEETGTMRQGDAGWILGGLERTAVPPLLRQVIEARIARLDEGDQRLLAIAAVIGHTVPLTVWAAVGEVDEETVLAAAERGVETRLLVEEGSDDRVRFAHALIREALYEDFPGMRRRRIHRRVAETLVAAPAPDPDAIAYQFLQAGDDRAAHWLVVTGTRARHANAFATAIARYETAIALMERDATAPDDYGWVVYLLAVMYYYTAPAKGVALLTTVIEDAAAAGDRTLEAVSRFQRGLILNDLNVADALDDMAAAVRMLDAQPPAEIERIRQYLDPRYSPDDDRAAVARELAIVGRFGEAMPLAEPLVRDGRDPLGQPYADGAWAMGLHAAARGDAAAARHWLDLAHVAFRSIGMDIALFAVIADEIATLLAFAADDRDALARLCEEAERINAAVRDAGFAHYAAIVCTPLRIVRGEWDGIEERLLPVIAADDGPSYFAPGRFIAPIARYRGDHEAARRYIKAFLPMDAATEPGIERLLPALAMQRVSISAALDTGDLPTAREWLDAHDRWRAWAGAALGQSEGQELWARYHRRAGDSARAGEHARCALRYATEPRQPLALLAAHRLLGELDTEAGRSEDAAVHLNESLALAEACQAPFERALTHLAMAELMRTTGETDAATRLLSEALAICEPLGAKPTLARAGILAARLKRA